MCIITTQYSQLTLTVEFSLSSKTLPHFSKHSSSSIAHVCKHLSSNQPSMPIFFVLSIPIPATIYHTSVWPLCGRTITQRHYPHHILHSCQMRSKGSGCKKTTETYFVPTDERLLIESIALKGLSELSKRLENHCSELVMDLACYYFYPPCNTMKGTHALY